MIFFFNDTATTEIYTLSLHDALPIFTAVTASPVESDRVDDVGGNREQDEYAEYPDHPQRYRGQLVVVDAAGDRKSTRLNSSHANISYAVFCLKKQNTLLILLLLP